MLVREASDHCDWNDHVISYPKTNSWNKSIDCCLWDGVACDGVTSNVIGVDLACSWLHGPLQSNSSLFLLRHLQSLNLFGNNFIGSHISPNLSAFAKLTHLNLSSSQFVGIVPSEISCFSKLVSLDLFVNYILDTVIVFSQVGKFNLHNDWGTFPGIVFQLPTLTTLDISHNFNLFGVLPKSNWTSPLESLSLQFTSFSGDIPNSIGNMKNLTILDLSCSRFTGHIPSSMWNLHQLQVLRIANHSFSEVVEFENFTKLKNLRQLLVSQELNLIYDALEYTFPKLEQLGLYSCNLTKFPYFLTSLKRLTYLDLSFNMISGEIPMWFWGISHDTMEMLDLSNNLLEGGIQHLHETNLQIIYIWNNSFHGPLPILPPSTIEFDASENGPIPFPSPVTFYYSIASNKMTGKIPSFICNFTELEIIDLSNNTLTGSLPRCLTNFGANLSVLNLRMNYLEGIIPQSFSLRSGLMTLDLSQNQFEGMLPQSLVKCRHLKVLDLNNNRREDTLWLGTLPELKILVLRSNNLKGLLNIPRGGHLFPKLHILDLSNNNFSGPLPTNLMMSLKAMRNGKNGQDKSLYMTRDIGGENSELRSYENSVTLTMKEQEIWLLHSLVGLNLSHNHLTGSIPLTLGNLTSLGWLDLSSNKLSGVIPRKLGDLASLGCLNLSKNQLTSRIPQDK
ncbi:hypothetical protein EUGRSUZ_E04369 [Eucalyptus grandis]|uniref:Uncharacterized protein n=2 Tax=Eucalyptus grandis TaxID=71139 RepID=A0ACC3L1T5_EUCGR|nr:hypothetical protein EUGRSUZ_E04369 [Eucalyptus grandis]